MSLINYLHDLIFVGTAKGTAFFKSIYCYFIDILISEEYFENKILN